MLQKLNDGLIKVFKVYLTLSPHRQNDKLSSTFHKTKTQIKNHKEILRLEEQQTWENKYTENS